MIPSAKKLGKYERKLLVVLTSYFKNKGFKVYPHVQLNIAWGSIISDVDLVAIGGGKLIGVEVKSRRDKFANAFRQIEKIRDFFDMVYIASDKPRHFLEKRWKDKRTGLLLIENGKVIEKKGKILLTKPSHSTLVMLRKICLLRLSRTINSYGYGSKDELASNILLRMRAEHLKLILKSIVTCERECEILCPVWDFESRLFTPLRNVQRVLESYTPKDSIPLIPAEISEDESDEK